MGWNIVFYVPAESMTAQQYEKKNPLVVHRHLTLLGHSFHCPWQGLNNFKRGEEIDLQQK